MLEAPKIRALFFDAGNTLIFPRVEELAAGLCAQGFPATTGDFEAAERAGKRKLDDWLWPQIRARQVPMTVDAVYWTEYVVVLLDLIRVPEPERERVTRDLREGFRNIRLWSHVLPGTPEYLQALRDEGYFLGVISNSIGTMKEQLERVGLGPYFHTVLDSAIVGVEKPHPEIFEQAVTRARVAPAEALFVGDTYATDIGGARLAGLGAVLMDRVGAYAGVEALECPRITTLPALSGILATPKTEPH